MIGAPMHPFAFLYNLLSQSDFNSMFICENNHLFMLHSSEINNHQNLNCCDCNGKITPCQLQSEHNKPKKQNIELPETV